jgi:flagellar hook assembly protein FlgD
MREYHSKSTTVGQTAMVGVTDVVSNLAPNPTRGSVTFSVSIPRSFEETDRGPSRIPTDVDVRVYNVQGQLIRTLKRDSELNTVVTMRWDGTTQNGLHAPSGVYFLRVKAGDTEGVRKIVLLR